MDATIIAGILGLAGTISSPFITEYVKAKIEYKNAPDISPERIKKLEGQWSGKVIQETPEAPANGDITLTFSVKGKKITGSIHQVMQIQNVSRTHQFSASGYLYQNKYLVLNYVNIDPILIQFGSVLLEISDAGEMISGRYLAYGPHSKRIVYGIIALSKK